MPQPSGFQSPGCYLCPPSISGDGGTVVFMAPGLRSGIVVHSRTTGFTRKLLLDFQDDFVVSADGRFIAFKSRSTDLVPNDTNGHRDVFIYDLLTDLVDRVSVSSGGAQANNMSSRPSISADGRFVVFQSVATNLSPADEPDTYDLFVRDRQTGITEQLNVGFDPPGDADRDFPHAAITQDGRFVAVEVRDLVIHAKCSTWDYRLYLRDRQARTNERIDVNDAGEPANGRLWSDRLTISADGSIVAFVSDATNLVPEDADSMWDIFIRDRVNHTTRKMQVRHPEQRWRQGSSPAMTPDGRFIAFASVSDELVPGDTNNNQDVFVYDRGDAPDDRDDLLVNFGPQGLWERLNDSTWTQIGGRPSVIASGDLDGNTNDEAIGGFSGRGLLARYNNRAPWRKLHDAVPLRIAVGDFNGEQTDDLAADFGSAGLWARVDDGAWKKIHPSTSGGLEVGDLDGDGNDDLIADLKAAGLWVRFNNAKWVKLRPDSPNRLATGDLDGNGKDELIADYGSLGILARYNNQGIWVRLPNGPTQGLQTGDLDGNGRDDIVADFGSRGIWAFYNNSAPWVKLDPRNPAHIAVADLDKDGKADVTADFPPSGVWVAAQQCGAV